MIYIHVPFCHRKCTYCAFFSKPESAKWNVVSYVDALLEEMEQRKAAQPHPIRTVYFGGGTPSILPVNQLARIVESLRRCFDLSHVEEVTLEANPEDLSTQYLADLANLHFFNRLSIGVQCLDDQTLRLIGRRHTAQQALDAVENAHRASFLNISLDFIYGLPHLTSLTSLTSSTSLTSLTPLTPLTSLTSSTSLISLTPLISHLSAYALTVEPGTALARQVEQGRVSLPGDDEVVRQYHTLRQRFEAAGFRQYEVSNYARPGFESRHNSRYWDRTPYLGLGPGAHSFDGRRRRWNNPDGTVGEETLTPADAFNELLMTSLRTVRGLDLSLVPEQYKEKLHRQMQPYIDCGWIKLSTSPSQPSTLHSQLSTFYRPTPDGLLHADGIAAALFI